MSDPSFSDTIVFQTELVRIGAFRCDRHYPEFSDTGPAANDCFVFPRTAVAIEHQHEPPFAANPNVVTFYNRAQRYLRHEISSRGDQCDWFGVERNLAREIVRESDPSVEEQPFSWTRGPCDAATYFAQRRLFLLVSGGAVEPLVAEELVVLLLERVVRLARPAVRPGRLSGSQRTLAYEIECLLGARFDEPLSLTEIAAQLDTSVYRMCRTFRQATGLPLHRYLQGLRIRNGLERVCESRDPLSRIAVDLGFAHHSHFTSAFRRTFGRTPSGLRPRVISCGERRSSGSRC